MDNGGYTVVLCINLNFIWNSDTLFLTVYYKVWINVPTGFFQKMLFVCQSSKWLIWFFGVPCHTWAISEIIFFSF